MEGRCQAIAFLVQKIGPYHHARLLALAADKDLAVHALEFRPTDAVYAWDRIDGPAAYRRQALASGDSVAAALESLRPDAVVCVGYSDPEIHRAAAWAMGRAVPLVTCSDSTYDDEPRSVPKERFKRWVVSAFDSALVAGSRAHDYLGTLGMNGASRFRPWDVVDNAYFERFSDEARRKDAETRQALRLPPRYFLCVARFVPKKNLGMLLSGYADYAAKTGGNAWSLVLSGAGPLEGELREKAKSLDVANRVHFPGFVQYGDLPALYGLAAAFVLPSASDQWGLVVNEAMASGLPVLVSSRCGCAPDLVLAGENGFSFDPSDSNTIADGLERIASLPADRLSAMGHRSRETISSYSPTQFAAGLRSAIAFAMAKAPRHRSWMTRLSIRILAARPVR